MPNEFEKIVQQKMDELNLVPSAPVWQKVEVQIRKKKDRRRVIFWMVFLALLLGCGLWLGIDHYSNDVAYHKPNNKSQEQNQITSSTDKQTTAQPVTTNEKANEKSVDRTIRESKKNVVDKPKIGKPENKDDVDLTNEVSDRSHKEVKIETALIDQTAVQKPSSQKIQPQKENIIVSEETVQVKNNDSGFTRMKMPEVLVVQQFEKINQVVSSFDVIQAIDTTRRVLIDKIGIKPAITNADSLKHDTASIKTPATKKLAESKWKFNMVAASGLSGLNNLNFLSVLGGQKSMDASYATNPGTSQSPGASYYRPSSIRKGLSFSFGVTMQKQLSKRLQFLVGLQYNYYSNSNLVGDKIRRDTMFRAYSVSQYFTNNVTAYSYSASFEHYHNYYHFISLPLTIDWQLFKKLPLNFYAGFSVQQMLQTNAVVFDYNAQAYFHNNKAFNKTLVFTEYGLNYSIPLNKRYLSVGPEFQYGLTRLEKNNADHHLFFYGLKAQLQLNKK